MSQNEIAAPVNLAEMVRDKVRQTLFASIPDTEIDRLVKKEWDEMFRTPEKRNQWDAKEQPKSQFAVMVSREVDAYLQEKVKESVKQEISKCNLHWGDQGHAFVSEFVKLYAPSALEGLAARMAAKSVADMIEARGMNGIGY